MSNRVLHSGCEYDAGLVPVAQTRRSRKDKASDPEKASEAPTTYVSETPEGSGDKGEHTTKIEQGLITFGSIPASECRDDTIVLKGKGKRKAVTWVDDNGVRISPHMYQTLFKSTPPIKPMVRLSMLQPKKNQVETDAHDEMEAHVLVALDASKSEQDALADVDVEQEGSPIVDKSTETPLKTESALGIEQGRSGDSIYVMTTIGMT